MSAGGFPAGVFGSFEEFGKYRGDDYAIPRDGATALSLSVSAPVESTSSPVVAVTVAPRIPIDSRGRRKTPKPKDFTQVPLPAGDGGVSFDFEERRRREFWPQTRRPLTRVVRVPVAVVDQHAEDMVFLERLLADDAVLLAIL